MLRRQGRALSLALALLVWAGAPARAQDLGAEIGSHMGQSIDLRTNLELRDELIERGLISADTFNLKVTPELAEHVFASERFKNHVNVVRYHVGDRILIEDDGSGGSISPRAEIAEVLPDGRYKVKIWDKARAENHPTTSGTVDVFTGEVSSRFAGTKTKIIVHDANGNPREEYSDTPWLVRDNEREEILTHDQVEKLNGVIKPSGPYSVNGWKIDPATDPVLAERIAKARAAADKILPPSVLELPADPVARQAKLDEIARLQEKFLNQVFKDNFIDHPGNEPAATKRMSEYLSANPDMRGKVGAVLASKCGVCTDQAAAMVAILNDVGPRVGISSIAIGGSTIKERAGHGFVSIRFANGKLGMYDVTWHFESESQAVDNLDFSTYDERRNSNRTISWKAQETTDKTPFVDPNSPQGRALERGYDAKAGEAFLAAAARERADRDHIPVKDAAEKVIAENGGTGSFDANAIAAHAEKISSSGPAPTIGFLGGLERLLERALERDHPSDR